jgi:predicted nuclease with TOPRIM domain
MMSAVWTGRETIDEMEELPMSEQENFERIYGILQQLVAGVDDLRNRVGALEAKDAITKPLWQEMRADQQRILERMDSIETHLQRQDERLDRIEAGLAQQDEKIVALDEKVTVGFRKLGDKFEHIVMDYYELHSDMRDLQRRVTQPEPVN